MTLCRFGESFLESEPDCNFEDEETSELFEPSHQQHLFALGMAREFDAWRCVDTHEDRSMSKTPIYFQDPAYTDEDKHAVRVDLPKYESAGNREISVMDDPQAFLHIDRTALVIALDITQIPVRQIIADAVLSEAPAKLPAIIIWSERSFPRTLGGKDIMSPTVTSLLQHYRRLFVESTKKGKACKWLDEAAVYVRRPGH